MIATAGAGQRWAWWRTLGFNFGRNETAFSICLSKINLVLI